MPLRTVISLTGGVGRSRTADHAGLVVHVARAVQFLLEVRIPQQHIEPKDAYTGGVLHRHPLLAGHTVLTGQATIHLCVVSHGVITG